MLCVKCRQELPNGSWFCPECSHIQPLLPGAAASSDSRGIEPVRLVTKRLLLRPFQDGDAEDVSQYTVDPRWSQYLVNIPLPYTLRRAEEYIALVSNPRNWVVSRCFALVLGEKVIGAVYLNLDRQNGRADMGYDLSPAYWGQGLATEASKMAMDWGFGKLGLNKISAHCDPRNTCSWHVMEKLGMSREGLFRHHIQWRGEVRDMLYYSILRIDRKG